MSLTALKEDYLDTIHTLWRVIDKLDTKNKEQDNRIIQLEKDVNELKLTVYK